MNTLIIITVLIIVAVIIITGLVLNSNAKVNVKIDIKKVKTFLPEQVVL